MDSYKELQEYKIENRQLFKEIELLSFQLNESLKINIELSYVVDAQNKELSQAKQEISDLESELEKYETKDDAYEDQLRQDLYDERGHRKDENKEVEVK